MKTTVIYHSADFDGIFCREIARKFLPPDTQFIGWNFGDEPLHDIHTDTLYVMDLPVDRPFGFSFPIPLYEDPTYEGQRIKLNSCTTQKLIWIDHHRTSIESHPAFIPGYRIDGVAACRLAWQWFQTCAKQFPTHICTGNGGVLPTKSDFIHRMVSEPRAVRLAGEYDIWCKDDPNAELLQHGLRAQELTPDIWNDLLAVTAYRASIVDTLLDRGQVLQYARGKEYESIIKDMGFTFQWEGLTWLACNAARYNSLLFAAALKPEHDACFGFKFTGHCAGGKPCEQWSISLYHAPGKEHHDLSVIAKKHGGGGHRGAAGMILKTLPFLP